MDDDTSVGTVKLVRFIVLRLCLWDCFFDGGPTLSVNDVLYFAIRSCVCATIRMDAILSSGIDNHHK